MEPLEYPAALFSDVVSDSEPAKDELLGQVLDQDKANDDNDWVQVYVRVDVIQKFISSTDEENRNITEDDAIQEASRDKVLEMLDYTKPGPAPQPPEELMDPVPLPPQSSSGKLFVPSKRPTRSTAYNPNAQFQCPQCSAGFTRMDNMRRHIKILHQGSECYTCQHCNRNFTRRNTLQRHVAALHTREKKYSCRYCNETFIYSWEVQVHTQNKHHEEQGYKCDICGATFKWPRSLMRHTQAVHEGIKYKCTECTTVLASLEAFKKHGQRFHPLTQNGPIKSQPINPLKEECYMCHYCNTNFRCKTNLDKHIHKIHRTNQGSIQCQYCSNVFQTHQIYERHVNKFHGMVSEERLTHEPHNPHVFKEEVLAERGVPQEVEEDMEISLTQYLTESVDYDQILFPNELG